jgi:hypothetical protein
MLKNGELIFKDNVLSGCVTNLAVASGSTFDISTWFNAQGQTIKFYHFQD